MPDHFNPAPVLQSLHHVLRHRHAAYALNVASRHRLLVGNNRQRFHYGAGIARRTLLLKAAQPLECRLSNLKPPALVRMHQLQRPTLPTRFQLRQYIN